MPKILVFLVAVFSQFINKELTNIDKTIIVMVAGVIDTFWYVLVAMVLAETKLIVQLKKKSIWIDRFTGAILIVSSLAITTKIFSFSN